MIGMFVGLATGLFFGEMAAPLKYIDDAFFGLLQMTVLPERFDSRFQIRLDFD
jgi:proton glutamate symport protein